MKGQLRHNTLKKAAVLMLHCENDQEQSIFVLFSITKDIKQWISLPVRMNICLNDIELILAKDFCNKE